MLTIEDSGGGWVSQLLTIADEGGRGDPDPPNMAYIFCEQSLTSPFLILSSARQRYEGRKRGLESVPWV